MVEDRQLKSSDNDLQKGMVEQGDQEMGDKGLDEEYILGI